MPDREKLCKKLFRHPHSANRGHPAKLARPLFGIRYVPLPFRLVRPAVSRYYSNTIAGGTIGLGVGFMDPDVADCVEGDEIILTVDVPDDILERAAGDAEGRAITWIYCTQVWYNCGWPQ
jgi:hypothetical protein